MKSYLNQQEAPRGIRNNNPGNLVRTAIKWRGKIDHSKNPDPKFEQFDTLQNGIRAMAIDIAGDITRKNLNTLRKLITAYAPPSENNTAAYIKSVSDSTGIKPDDIIKPTPEILGTIIAAKIRVENGAKAGQYVTGNDIAAAIKAIPRKTAAILKKAGTIMIFAVPLAILLFLLYYGRKERF